MKYFEIGGRCITGPVSLLSGYVSHRFSSLVISQRGATLSIHSIVPSPILLAIHFFAVAFYSIWVLFAHPRINPCTASSKETPVAVLPRIDEYPELIVFSFRVVCHSVRVRLESLSAHILETVLDLVRGLWPVAVE